MTVVIEKEYCDTCGKYMKYGAQGKCIKCKTFIYQNKSIKNTSTYDALKDMGVNKSESNIGGYDRRC